MKIYRFEKPVSRPQGGVRRGRETLELERPTLPEFSLALEHRPTLPEFSLEPRKGGAAVAPPPQQPQPRTKTTPPPVRGAPVPEPREPGRGSAPSEEAPPAPAPPSGLLAERMATARELFAQGQLSQARAILELLVSRGVGGAPARTLLGTIHMAQGSSERALACFEAALEADPSDLTARLYRGEVRLGWGDLLLAQEDMLYVLEAATAGSPLVQQARRLLLKIDELRDRKRR